ncbi:uncharacterized protein LOC129601687 isoform X2 [Paramacrobiotus metropolitanus]|uniref:uncharacterized protein LOC129601687 isoform X2 n=1 Tax=Paramacrobiotus metropolitanus TaxID=2943436 RepID=UPI002445B09F|nr:uncharacterized protein LOC129601687 isoform X2 [Paramacrobiotus metropolitanus]
MRCRMALYDGARLTLYTGFASGLVYIVCGIVALCASQAVSRSKPNAPCLAITVLMLSINSSLLAFGLLVYDSVILDSYVQRSVVFVMTGRSRLIVIELAFQALALIASCTVCVYSSKNITGAIATVATRTPVNYPT